MDFTVPDLLSTTSGSTLDEGVRMTRSTASSSATATRKSFSSVLERVRGEEGTASTRETGSTGRIRASNNAENRPDPKQTKGLNSSISQTERSDVADAHTSGGGKVSDGQHETGESSREEIEPSVQQSDARSEPEGQALTSTVPMIVLQAGVQATARETLVTHDNPHSSDREEGVATDPSPALVATDAPLRPTESRSSEKGTAASPPDVPEQNLDASMFQKGIESQAKQSAKPDGENDTRVTATDDAHAQSTILTSPSGETASSPNLNVHRIAQAHEGMMLPESKTDSKTDSKPDRNLVTPDQEGDGSVGQTTDKQAPLLVPSHGSQEDSGTRTQVLTPHGQQLVVDKAEQFGQLGHDRNDRQQGNPETKLFQGTVVDLQAVNGRTAEHYAAVVQGQTTSVPTAPTPSQFVPPALPAHHVTDVAQQPIASMLRSVVVDVAQPDLGHVNIRVAMMNDFVHAHFSTDRAEVGQYLMNGQDRLQTTLQASGLDMGQFRVDIDRQNGGRSFQQGLFQEQGQTWNQGSHGLEKEQVQGRPDDMRLSPQGRLNVVA